MEILTIIRKDYPTTVLKMKVGDLDKSKFSNKFLSHTIDESTEVYVKCDAEGNIEYRGKNQEYRLYDVNKHDIKQS